jgi:hypothetical protein
MTTPRWTGAADAAESLTTAVAEQLTAARHTAGTAAPTPTATTTTHR